MIKSYCFKNIWYICILFFIFIMILVGGLTRLTDSGLSMVDWNPIMGVIPPLNHGKWLAIFNDYKEYPQYQTLFSKMTLSEFKIIFFWEYLHRILGRILGLICIIPFLYLWLKKQLNSREIKQGFIIISLVVSQGLLGWYMVQSGLIDNNRVSHFRLAAHLSLALCMMQFVWWCFLSHYHISKKAFPIPYLSNKNLCFGLLTLVIIQIIFGAFTAGLRAGALYQTFPKMGGEWFPSALFLYPSVLNNIINNPFMIHFIHRWLGISIGIVAIMHYLYANKSTRFYKNLETSLLFIIALQVILGISTLILQIPIILASLHQLSAVLLLLLLIFKVFLLTHTSSSR